MLRHRSPPAWGFITYPAFVQSFHPGRQGERIGGIPARAGGIRICLGELQPFTASPAKNIQHNRIFWEKFKIHKMQPVLFIPPLKKRVRYFDSPESGKVLDGAN